MNSNTLTKSKTTSLHEILDWSVDKPKWQRDALRRIILNGSLNDHDIPELEKILKSDDSVASIPLNIDHLPHTPGTSESVFLKSLSDTQNINRLPNGSHIPFGNGTGLTVIYGDNGVGKSSYARVIKKACRSRGALPSILTNVFSATELGTPSAQIQFCMGSSDFETRWEDGAVSDPRLTNIFVFDSVVAEHYIGFDQAASFTPYGLDVLPKLSRACDLLNTRLKAEIDVLQRDIDQAKANWRYVESTQIGKLVADLSSKTNETDLINLAVLDEAQSQRIVVLREALKSDPLQKSRETKAAISRIKIFSELVKKICNELNGDKIETIRKKIDEFRISEKAMNAFSEGQFDTSFLNGTGSDLWRAMWDAARNFSALAYREQDFSLISLEPNCVLCQQPLTETGVNRMSKFDSFCKDKSQQIYERLTQELVVISNQLNSVSILGQEFAKIDTDLANLSVEGRSIISDFVHKADTLLARVKENLEKKEWIDSLDLPLCPHIQIQKVITWLESRAKTEELANNPEARKELELELKELEAREWLYGVKDSVIAQIGNLKAIETLKKHEKELKTKPITDKSVELAEQFITRAFKEKFKNESKELGLKTLDVTLEATKGKKGETKFGIRLVSPEASMVKEIASEGEKRCIALAAFLSELSQASHQSALVFDDPVSSLDIWYREKIAKRLTREAKIRQVIVFTHDILFLNELLFFSEQSLDMNPSVLTLGWNNGAPGYLTEGLPWDHKRPKDCLSDLESTANAMTPSWNPCPNESDIEKMRHCYSKLRSTLERMVEVHLFAGVIGRFQSHVKTGNLKSVMGISQVEIQQFETLLKKCHQLTEAHTPSQNRVPDPEEFKTDISAAKKLLEDIKTRNKSNQNSGDR